MKNKNLKNRIFMKKQESVNFYLIVLQITSYYTIINTVQKMSVKVGVRVRPFNKRQQQLGSRCCVQMINNTTSVVQQQTGGRQTFVFDYSFWSHDKFTVDTEGVNQPIDDKYADQKKVYNQIGSDILVNAWQGYNCCLFAYGQTGSGKSYSMLGYGNNKGIIPMVCDNIFERIKSDADKAHSYEVKVSMMEIYNETLRDLLANKHKKKEELKICESKKLGVYVEGLVKCSVESYEQIHKKIEQGSNNRSIAATLMNQSSSRSHTIVSITFLQRNQVSISQTSIKYSTINLVDLAGSESVGKTGVDSKDRLREAAKINQSLSTLGRVIQILASNSSKTDKQFVPYRDSKLTFILRNALGGNSRTAMICAISPSDDNYEETLSTLRYASRAKKIQNKAIVNQSDVDKLIRMLREQNQMLKRMLKQAKWNKTVINMQMVNNVQQKNKDMQQLGLFDDDQDKSYFEDFTNYSESNMSVLDQNQKIGQKDPFITNLSQDQLLSGRLKYSCAKILTIGNKQGVPRPNVVLAALGILPLHCTIRNIDGKIFIQINDDQATQYTFVNGENVHKDIPVQLRNYDRLIFGTGCVFLVRIPDGPIRPLIKQTQQIQLKPEDIDHTFAVTEMQQHHLVLNLTTLSQRQEEQKRSKWLAELQQEQQQLRRQNQEKLRIKLEQQEKQYKEKIQEIQKLKNEETRMLKQELQRQAKQGIKMIEEKQKIKQEIVLFKQLQKKLQETNAGKKQLDEARITLKQKQNFIREMQTNLLIIEAKQEQTRKQMRQKQLLIQKQLETKMIICGNQNILNEYKLQLSKKTNKANQLKQRFIKKQRIIIGRQLQQLVQMVQKFNLIAKQMKKNVQSGLSIDYTYLSETQILQLLKSDAGKNRMKISIHVHNKKEKRSYFWSVQIFKNRYEIANQRFELFFKNPLDPQLLNKQLDPYWDPPCPQLIGITFLSLQTLFYKLGYEGDLTIVKKGHTVGKIHVKTYLTGPKKNGNMSQQVLNGIVLFNPRDFIQKTLSFVLQFTNLRIQKEYQYTGVKIQYTITQNSFKNKHIESKLQKASQFAHQQTHTLADLSQILIAQYLDQPLEIKIWGELPQTHIEDDDDNLTSREDATSFEGSVNGSFISPKQNQILEIDTESISLPINNNGKNLNGKSVQAFTPSPVKNKNNQSFKGGSSGKIVSNNDVMSKIDLQYEKKKEEAKKMKNMSSMEEDKRDKKNKKGKDDCKIF